MNTYQRFRLILLPIGALLLGAATTFAQGARGGGTPGTAGLALPMPEGGLPTEALTPPALNDLEVTQITKAELGGPLGKATQAATAAEDALTKASFTLPANPQDIQAKAQALADAELAQALARADVFAEVRKTMKDVTPEKKQAIQQQMSGGGGGRGRG